MNRAYLRDFNEVSHIETAKGRFSIHRRGASLVTVVEGHLDTKHAPSFIVEADRLIASERRAYIYHDWAAMTGYDSVVRRAWTHWASHRLRGMPEVHFLTGTTVVRMGVSVAAAAVAVFGIRFVLHAERADFERCVTRTP
jgi:hypothetical protein